MSNRRLIAMITGRATAGDLHDLHPFAAQPRAIRALSRLIGAVGGAGIVALLATGVGGGFATSAASAHGTVSTNQLGTSDTVAGLAASAAVHGSVLGIDGNGATPATLSRRATAMLQGIVLSPTPGLPVATLATIRVAPVAPVPSSPAATARQIAPTTSVTPRPVAPPLAVGSVEAIITEVFGAHAQQAIGVARCESHLNPAAISRNGANWGLFQINVAHKARVAQMGYRWEDLLNPRVNAIVAKSIFDQQGWGPWACRGAAR